MKRMSLQMSAVAAALAAALVFPSTMRAQSASESMFKAKCAACHGSDGTGSPMGKKLGAHDFTADEVQKMPDADLSNIIANGKNKMPAYKALSADDVKGLVTYIRTLKK
jgi:mono/diheme cytochrome c family protein